jgi:pyruvate kinase
VVRHGGPLSSHKGINIPGVRVSLPSITAKDEADLAFALEHGVDWIAMSFVHEARDVVDLKRRIAQAERAAARTTPVIAKIENPLAVEKLNEILEVSDGIMVARGDLGVELGPEELPVVQKRIIVTARRRWKLVITATQMLDSMTHHPGPTRAEASDVANAIFDGTDVVMLSQETAVGEFPVRAVETMRNIALFAERSALFRQHMEHFQRPVSEGVAHAAIRAACVAAEEVRARAVVAFSTSGWTARSVSSWRPDTGVYALTHLEDTWQRLALCWGLRPFLIPRAETLDEEYVLGMATLLRAGALRLRDLVVVLSGSLLRGSGANTIRIYRVGTGELTDDPATREKLEHLSSPGLTPPDEEVDPPGS